MKKFLFLLLIFPAVLFPALLYSQTNTLVARGSLLKININNANFSLSDTAGYWIDSTYQYVYLFSEYYDHLNMPNAEYFLKRQNYFYQSPSMTDFYGRNILETEKAAKSRQFSRNSFGWDVFGPYSIDRTSILKTKNGAWLMNGDAGNSFVFNNDSLYPIKSYGGTTAKEYFENRFLFIAGMIDQKLLAVFRGIQPTGPAGEYELILMDQGDTPDFDSSKAVKIAYNDSVLFDHHWPLKILKMPGDNLCLVWTYDGGLNIFSFSDNTLNFLKKGPQQYLSKRQMSTDDFMLRNNNLYVYSDGELLKFDYDSNGMEFINKKVLLKDLSYRNSGLDRDFKYLARIENDSLKVFDIALEKDIRSYNLSGIDSVFMPIVDSPYVYVHQTTYHFTAVDKDRNSVVKDYRLSAYPNPFNSSVKIQYSIPEDKEIEISIFDMLGRKIKSLVKGFERKGSHEVLFNASNLPSGIYFYNLSAGGGFNKTNKIVLMK